MKFSQITYLVVVLSVCFISCRDTLPIKIAIPSKEPNSSETPTLEHDLQNPTETHPEKELKKETSKKIDTLKPITVVP